MDRPVYTTGYVVSWLRLDLDSASTNASPGTNTYLVGRGHQRILIDTGEGQPTWATHLQSVLSEEKATIHQALLTHWHGDHVKGVSDLRRICPHATVFKHQPEKSDGHLEIQDGQVFRVDGATLTAYHTPGHTEDHMVFVLDEEDAMFTGDSKSSTLFPIFSTCHRRNCANTTRCVGPRNRRL